MTKGSDWLAGFEIEVILGGLGLPRFEDEANYEPMDLASPGFCQAVAKRLSQLTSSKWSAPRSDVSKPGFYVIPEYGLDPLDWPNGRLAGVELLTPPLPLSQAEPVRREIIAAIEEIDGSFNFIHSGVTEGCAWHINIDAGDAVELSPDHYMVGTDELLLLSRNGRLFSEYAGLQRHSVGIPILRYLREDRGGALLHSTGLSNILLTHAGRGKGYAANFAKLERGYVELRHFSAVSFFDGMSLIEHLERVPAALEIWFSQSSKFEEIFLEKFKILSEWLDEIRPRLKWDVGRFNFTLAKGVVLFDDETIGTLLTNGPAELHLHGQRQYEYIASIRQVLVPDVAEAVALLALDISELRNLGVRRPASASKAFQKAVSQLADRLKSQPILSSEYQLCLIREAERERSKMYAGR